MDEASLAEVVGTIGLAIALAACAGLRAWLPLFLAGLLSRAGVLQLGAAFQFLGSTRALVLFGCASLIEILADKVPVVDHTLDALSTVLRPAIGALLAASVIGRFEDPLVALALGTAVGAPAALVPHAAKSSLRVASSALTAGVANPVLSVVEDVSTVALFAFAVVLPVVTALALLALGVVVLRRFVRRRPGPAAVKTA
jgi:Domain of unknown function (DUF4126)